MCKLTKQIDSQRQAIESLMINAGFDKVRVNQEMSFAKQLVANSNYLQKCDANTVMAAIVNIANTGLSLNPALGHAYLIPRAGKATLMPSYQGLLHLLYKESDFKAVNAQLVYDNDEFDFNPVDFIRPVTHKPNLKGERGDFVGAYAIALHKDGYCQAEYMSALDIYRIRATSESYKYYEKNKKGSCIWVDWFEEMTRKTVIKRLFKYLSKAKDNKLSKAIELDNQEYQADLNQITYIDTLLTKANISPEQVNQIEREMHGYSWQAANDCIDYLKANQLDPAADGRYNMTDARRMVEDAVENESK